MSKSKTRENRAGPAAYIEARLARLRGALVAKKLPALLVTNFADVSYLTGFEGDDSYLLVLADGGELLISDSRFEEQIGREAPWVKTYMRQKPIVPETVAQLKRLKVSKLGVQAESMTLAVAEGLKNELGGKTKLIPAANVVVDLRHIKDAEEIAITERAIVIAEEAFESMKRQLKLGMTESDMAGLLGYEMRKRGALNSSFDTIIGINANASLPHYRPGDVKLTEGAAVLVDWGARYRGYCSDLTRMVFINKIDPRIGKIYDIVLKAQVAAIEAIKPDLTGKKIDKVARDIIKKAGYGKQFGHGTGHGMGRDIHEALSLSRFSTTTLKPGMLVTVEPGIYLPQIGGVRIEDDVLVTSDGHRVLSHASKDIESAIVRI